MMSFSVAAAVYGAFFSMPSVNILSSVDHVVLILLDECCPVTVRNTKCCMAVCSIVSG